jgi:hypothetical protein
MTEQITDTTIESRPGDLYRIEEPDFSFFVREWREADPSAPVIMFSMIDKSHEPPIFAREKRVVGIRDGNVDGDRANALSRAALVLHVALLYRGVTQDVASSRAQEVLAL